jgi:hypothetical protein
MGNFLNHRIARVDEPKQISLVNNPNFITFSSKGNRNEDKPMVIKIRMMQRTNATKSDIILTFTDVVGNKHMFIGVSDKNELTENSFLLVYPDEGEEEASILASLYNLRDCLLRNSFIKNNFDVFVPLTYSETNEASADTVELISKGVGEQYNVVVACFNEPIKDKIIDSEFDISIKLNDIDDSVENVDALYFTWNASYFKPGEVSIRPMLVGFVRASLDNNDDEYFRIVKPEKGVLTYKQAKLATLKNLKRCMERQYVISMTASIHLNEDALCLECFFIKQYPYYYFEGIYSRNTLFDIYRKREQTVSARSVDVWYYQLAISQTLSNSSDTIDRGNGGYQLLLDVYTDTYKMLGSDDKLQGNVGTYLTTLSKSYFGKPLWFEVNTLMSKRSKYSTQFLTELENASDWVDAGTVTDYYLIAKRYDGVSNIPFFVSDILYVINGCDYTLNNVDLDKYVLDFSQDFYVGKYNKVTPLTTNQNRTHIKGQRQYFNFIFKNAELEDDSSSYSIALQYRLFTQSGVPVGEYTDQSMDVSELNMVNTALLSLDRFLPQYNAKTVGRIDVALVLLRKSENQNITYPPVTLSESLSFRILPQFLHKVNDFAFLNRLGGWDSFNFGGTVSSEFKSTASTIYKTLQPNFNHQSEIESISSRTIQEQTIVQTSPITSDVVDWLREMSASVAVYELSTKRYIIVDDMTLKYNTKEDLYQVEMKYHYSDTYNGRVK